MFYPIAVKLIKTMCKKDNSQFYGFFIPAFLWAKWLLSNYWRIQKVTSDLHKKCL